jgi:hypothetical protein
MIKKYTFKSVKLTDEGSRKSSDINKFHRVRYDSP